MPIGLVSTRASPGRAPALVVMRSGCTSPITAMPYFGSGSSMEWPPSTKAPAARATSAPPRSTSPSNSYGFAAAMRPKSYASSTMGVKKSTVATIARSAVKRNTAASSRVAASTRIRGSVAAGT